MADTDTIMRYIRIFSELSSQMKYSSQKRVLIEIALIKLTKPAMENDIGSLNNRMTMVEKKIESGDIITTVAAGSEIKKEQSKPKKVFAKPVPADIQEVVNNWGRIKRHISNPYKTYLENARFSVKGEDTLLIVFNSGSIGYEGSNKPEVIEMLTNVISEEIEKQVKVEMTILENNQNFGDYFMEVVSKINMEVEEEDF